MVIQQDTTCILQAQPDQAVNHQSNGQEQIANAQDFCPLEKVGENGFMFQ
jgi:hypothetical protein